MFHRLAMPLLFMVVPRLLPHVIRLIRLVWRLTFDRRVPLLLRMLVPLAVIYVISPVDLIRDWVPIVGRFDDVLVLGLSVLFLTKLSPKHVLEDIQGPPPVRARPEDKDPSNVVDGSARVVDDA